MQTLCHGCRQCPQSLLRLAAGGSSAVVVEVEALAIAIAVALVVAVGEGVDDGRALLMGNGSLVMVHQAVGMWYPLSDWGKVP